MKKLLIPAVLLFSGTSLALAQKSTDLPLSTISTAPTDQDHNYGGTAPDDPGPLATDLSPAFQHEAITKAMSKVADWQIRDMGSHFNQRWTFAALYDGLLAASKTTGNPAYRQAVVNMGEHFHWQLMTDRFPLADDLALGQSFLDLYMEDHKPEELASTKAFVDKLVAREDDPEKPLWWWADSFFMGPPEFIRMYTITGDRKYLDYMDHEMSVTIALLYDSNEHLFYRDGRFLTKHETNGSKMFWARGNGWVLGGLVSILKLLPTNDPLRPKYEKLFRDVATRVASLQGSDGLWRTGLLNPGAYPSPEVSGSAFYTYALAYGARTGLLKRSTTEPVVKKAWAGLLSHIYADGRLGSIQPVGFAPEGFKPSSTHVYGVGGFLLAGAEIDKLNTEHAK